MLPIVIGGEMKSYIAGSQNGTFFIWQNMSCL